MSTPDLPDTIEYTKVDYLDVTMSNLSLGALPQSTSMSNGCERKEKMKNPNRRSARYPDFWRKTLANKILEHKNKFNKKKISYEVLRPSKLQFIKYPEPSAQFPTGGGRVNLSEENLEFTGSISDGNLAARPSNSLPDFTSLKIDSQTDLTTATKTKSAINLARLSAIQWVKKPPKWKSRAKSSLKECRLFPSLPTIAEDTPESQLLDPVKCVSLNTQGQGQQLNGSGNAPQSCSQQALTEDDITIDELASYLDLLVHIPKKMSPMAEMMYT